MSEQQPADDELAFPDLKPGDAWGESITQHRADELERILQRWEVEKEHSERKGPFHNIQLTGADVLWLAAWTLGQRSNRQTIVAQVNRLMNVSEEPLDRIFNDPLQMPDLHLEGARLYRTHLEGAMLEAAHMEGASLDGVYLRGAHLFGAHLEHATLSGAHLERALLGEAHLQQANLSTAHLEGAVLDGTHLEGATIERAHLSRTILSKADLRQAKLDSSHLEEASFLEARLERASLFMAKLTGADLTGAHLEHAYLSGAHLEGSTLWLAHLEGATLRGAWFDSKTELNGAILDSKTCLGDIQWSGVGAVNLTQLDWRRVSRLGDESALNRNAGVVGHETAERAYRQLATQLRAQGMSEVADRFFYRAQLRQRRINLRRLHILQYLGSLFLDLISGYGYRPVRSFITYIVVILAFAGAYLLNAQFAAPHLTWDEAIVLSVSAFHGRGFFTSGISLGDMLARLAAIEAIIGLLIEITFIATFTQRFFAR